MNITNPKIEGGANELQDLLAAIPKTNPARYVVSGTIEVPDWRGIRNHFQGIAPMNGDDVLVGQISASADTWWCASFIAGLGHTGRVTDVFGSEHFDHAGGIQRLGDILPMPLENDEGRAVVAFYDVTSADTRYMYEIEITGKASAAPITTYKDSGGIEQALLLVYQYEPRTFQIFRTRADLVTEKRYWEKIGDTNELPDPTMLDDQCQSFALVTQVYGHEETVYLLGFRENEAILLCTVDTGSTSFGTLTHVATYEGFESPAEWRYGVGLQICSARKIRIFGCTEDPTGEPDDYTFPIYVWG